MGHSFTLLERTVVGRLMSGQPAQEFLRHVLELRGEFFHGCIFASHFTGLLTVQSYLRDDGATENSLIDVAKRPGHEAS